MAATDTAAVEAKDAVTEGTLLLFELETVAFAGRKKLFDLLKKNVAAVGVQLTPPMYSRFGLKPTPEQAVVALAEQAGKEKGDPAKVGADVAAAYAADLGSKAEAHAGIVKLLGSAAKKGLHLGALSALPQDAAEATLKNLGLSNDVKLQAHKPEEIHFPRAESWVKLMKQITKANLPGIAIVSSQASLKSALAAGLRVIVVADEFTNYQDFSGADFVAESASDLDVNEALAVITQQ